MIFDHKKYDEYTDAEKQCIKLGTIGLLYAIKAKHPAKASSMAAAINRKSCHAKPNLSRKLKRWGGDDNRCKKFIIDVKGCSVKRA